MLQQHITVQANTRNCTAVALAIVMVIRGCNCARNLLFISSDALWAN